MQGIWGKLPEMLTSMSSLKRELRITAKDEEEYTSEDDAPFIESVAQTRK